MLYKSMFIGQKQALTVNNVIINVVNSTIEPRCSHWEKAKLEPLQFKKNDKVFCKET